MSSPDEERSGGKQTGEEPHGAKQSGEKQSGAKQSGEHVLKIARRVFDATHWFYPRPYRRRHRQDLNLLFDDLQRLALASGGWMAVVSLLVRSVVDAAISAVAVRRLEANPSALSHQRGKKWSKLMIVRTDLSNAWRSVWRKPALSWVAVATLAIGIGASVSMFSIVYGVLLRPLGLEQPDRLVNIRQHHELDSADSSGLSPAVFRPLSEQLDTAEGVAGWFFDSLTLTTGADYLGDSIELSSAIDVSTNFFDVLGVTPLHGRTFLPDDAPAGSGRGRAVILGNDFYLSALGGDPDVLGKSLLIDGEPATVVGVVSSTVPAPIPGTDIWLAHGLRVEDQSLTRRILPLARLKPGVSPEQADASLQAIYRSLEQENPLLADWTASSSPFRADLLGSVESGLWIAFAGIAMLLALACANYGNLMMARLSTKRPELSTRSCLGATRGSLFRHLVAESLVLAGVAGVFGVGCAYLAHQYLVTLATGMLPRLAEIRLDAPILLFAFALTLVCGLLFGNAPAAWNIAGSLRPWSVRSRTAPGSGRALRVVLAGTQVALAVVLLSGAALLHRSFDLLTESDPGFDVDAIAAARIYLDDDRYDSVEKEALYFDQLQGLVEALPGVASVATTSALPMDPEAMDYDLPFRRADQPPPEDRPQAYYRVSFPGYFETMGIAVLEGRSFANTDSTGPPVVVINQTMAQRVWPDGDALGGQLRVRSSDYEVVGIVDDTSFSALGAEPKPEMYFPKQWWRFGGRILVVRSTGDPADLLPAIRASALSVDPNQPPNAAMTLSRLTADSVAAQRFYSRLSGAVGVLALILAVSGVYALMAFWVSRSRFEVGVRMAVGATRQRILALVLLRALRIAVLGSLAGIGAALLLLGNLESLLFEISPLEPSVLILASSILIGTAMMAAVLPARTASRLPPTQVLRAD